MWSLPEPPSTGSSDDGFDGWATTRLPPCFGVPAAAVVAPPPAAVVALPPAAVVAAPPAAVVAAPPESDLLSDPQPAASKPMAAITGTAQRARLLRVDMVPPCRC